MKEEKFNRLLDKLKQDEDYYAKSDDNYIARKLEKYIRNSPKLMKITEYESQLLKNR